MPKEFTIHVALEVFMNEESTLGQRIIGSTGTQPPLEHEHSRSLVEKASHGIRCS